MTTQIAQTSSSTSTSTTLLSPSNLTSWQWPLDLTQYERTGSLSQVEKQSLFTLFENKTLTRPELVAAAEQQPELRRLLQPLKEVFTVMDANPAYKPTALSLLLRNCAREQNAFWGWDTATWLRLLGPTQKAFCEENGPVGYTEVRQYLIAAAYLLKCFQTVHQLGGFDRRGLANKIFGTTRVTATLDTVQQVVLGWGYSARETNILGGVVADVLLEQASVQLEELHLDFLEELRSRPGITPARRIMIYRLSKVLAHLGIVAEPLPLRGGVAPEFFEVERARGIAAEWVEWAERWYNTSTLTLSTRRHVRDALLKAGRWQTQQHPEIKQPQEWTRELAAEYVAAVSRMAAGDYVWCFSTVQAKLGEPLSPARKDHLLSSMRQGFSDSQEWGWIERRFNPFRVFGTPRTIKNLLGPKPRVIEDDVWAKLLWAGLNLKAEDFHIRGKHHHQLPPQTEPGRQRNRKKSSLPLGPFYPLEMLRALAMVWLFAGLRSDEIMRLRIGCSRLQLLRPSAEGSASTEPAMVCMLEIPVNKTGRAFTKPVDVQVGQAIEEWEKVHPAQPDLIDPKTGEKVQFLFCYRAHQLAKNYLNDYLIPALCDKAGVPHQDARGRISSHRARSTIASQLFNAREPMSLSELQAWLGHRSPATTQHYVATSPTRLAKAYNDAGYFARNTRAIEVLIDRQVIEEGLAGQGVPWRYYDLGHGFCSYDFFDQCPHRMACARCDFYIPKTGSGGQLLEAKAGLMRLIQEIPLSEEERAAVDGDLEALERLLERLKTIPAPGDKRKASPNSNFISIENIRSSLPLSLIHRKSAKEEDGKERSDFNST